MLESVLENDTEEVTFKSFTIRGCYYKDRCFPSLNDYLSELGRNPRCGGRFKKKYVMVAINAIRRDLRGYKTLKPVRLHYTFGEPVKGRKRDIDNVIGCAFKFINDAIRDCKVIKDDDPRYLVDITHKIVYVDKPFIKVEIEEIKEKRYEICH